MESASSTMLVVVVVAWVVVAFISGAISTITVYVIVGLETDLSQGRGRHPAHVFHDPRLYSFVQKLESKWPSRN